MLSQSPDRLVGDRPAGAPRVLLVDDERAVRVAMLRFLTRRGWSVCEAEDGESARALLDPAAGRSFDLVICDLNMPRLSGCELYRWLLQHRPDAAARFVFASGDLLSLESAEFLKEARRPVLPKPFELCELAQIVDEVYSQAQAA
jgi:two-component system cell cycle sensor histidine kinase/response regulator CckA